MGMSPAIDEVPMSIKLNEDWLAVVIALLLLILALAGLIHPAWMTF